MPTSEPLAKKSTRAMVLPLLEADAAKVTGWLTGRLAPAAGAVSVTVGGGGGGAALTVTMTGADVALAPVESIAVAASE
jgi:hypothetical protein